MTFVSRREWAFLSLILLCGVLAWNGRFADWCATEFVLKMNDVAGIVQGFRAAPDLWSDGLKWWHGPWIQEGIGAFRPISSYLLWVDCFIGLRYGFFWTACVGVLLLWLDCALCIALAWRFTRSRWGVYMAALLAPAGLPFIFGGSQPSYWLAWFPVHHDLLMIGWLLAALFLWDSWLENGRRKYLLGSWACFVLGVWSKEFVYIFPFMALALTFGRRFDTDMARARGYRQVAWMMLFVVSMWFYRSAALPQAYNPPPLKWVHFLRRPFLYWFGPYYGFVLSGEAWFAVLAGWCFGLAGAIIRWKHSVYGFWLSRPFVPLGVVLGVLAVTSGLLAVFEKDLAVLFWYLGEGALGQTHRWQMAQMLATLYSVYLLWKYRRDEAGLVALAVMMMAYVPVWTYLGWHYTLGGWFIRCAVYWPVVVHLAARDLSGYWLDIVAVVRQRKLSSPSLTTASALE